MNIFFLSKILPNLVLPLGLALFSLVFASLRGSRFSRYALFVLWVFATPFVSDLIWRFLEYPYQRRSIDSVLQNASVDAVVVLGAGRHPAPGSSMVSEWRDADRFFAGFDAFHHLRAVGGEQPLIFTGGWWPSQPNLSPEGDVLRQRAIQLGISDTSVISTRKVRNTAEEAIEVASLLPPDSTVLLVTSAFHMPRARQLFNRQGVSVLPFPVDFQSAGVWAGNPWFSPLHYLPSASALHNSSRALREAIGRTIYRAW